MARLYVLGFILLLLSGIVGGAYYYYTDTQSRIATLTKKNLALELAAQECTDTLDQVQQNYSEIRRNLTALQAELNKSETYRSELQDKLRRHDLTRLTLEKPGLIERRVNDATKKIFEDLESDTSQ